MALQLDYESGEIHERTAVVVFSPGNSHNERLFNCNKFRIARFRIPFIHDVRSESFFVEVLPENRHSILVCAIPILPEIIAFEKSLQPLYQFVLHKIQAFYPERPAASIRTPSAQSA